MSGPRTDQELYDELSCYTLARGDAAFIHQNIVDAYAAQHAGRNVRTITTAFALIGLYLHVEKNYSGRKVQLAHIRLAKKRKPWPAFHPPACSGAVTVADVLRAEPGLAWDQAIKQWCISVWEAWHDSHQKVRDLARDC